MMSDIVNILHLSDLHFGMEPTEKIPSTAVDKRNLTLRELIKTLKKLDDKWQPNVVAITGDIAWKGIKADYDKAKDWLSNELLPVLKLSPDKLVVCPGNHDINRDEAFGIMVPSTSDEADECLKLERNKIFSQPFGTFTDFCKDMGISSPEIDNHPNFLTGIIELASLRFVVLNSAWFCRGDQDKDKLWLGKPMLQKMAANNQLIDPNTYDDEKSPVTIVLFHHPQEWLNEKETNTYGNRQNTLEYLSFRSHILLTGHVHARPAEPDRMLNRAYRIKGGAMYAGDTYQNHFSILSVNTGQRTFGRIAYEFDPGKNKWRVDVDSKKAPSYKLKLSASPPSASPLIIPGKYIEWVIAQCRDMDITKLAGRSSVIRVGLPEIYIPLFTNPQDKKKEKKRQKRKTKSPTKDRKNRNR
jgi:predicted MPP superfamily phosphohydrolase